MQPPVQNIVVIGSSAGGPRILKELFGEMPRLNASVVLIQHMPKFVNQSLEQSIARVTKMNVRIAQHGDVLQCGTLYIAPSEQHLRIVHNKQIQLFDGEKMNFVCPSVDVAMLSLNNQIGMQFVGVILTGMGRDGTDGIVHIKRLNGYTIAQDEETSVIFGMPKEAISSGCVDWILPPAGIRGKLVELVGLMPHDEKRSGGFL